MKTESCQVVLSRRADGEIRTHLVHITNMVLSLESYVSILVPTLAVEVGIEPTINKLTVCRLASLPTPQYSITAQGSILQSLGVKSPATAPALPLGVLLAPVWSCDVIQCT